MIAHSEIKRHQDRAATFLQNAGIALRENEQIEIADFGLNDFDISGLSIVVYCNTDRYCGKELILFPHQTCPQHMHPPVGNDPGKMETFRCRQGTVYLYVDGPATSELHANPPADSKAFYTVFHEIVLTPGQQYTIAPGTLHWFQAGPDGAIVTEFSSTSRDEADIFTDPRIRRVAEVI